MPWREPMEITAEERAALERWARRPKTAQALALRSRIVLACSDSGRTGRRQTDVAVAKDLGVTNTTVHKWRTRFEVDRLDGLSDEPRCGAPRRITDEQVEAVVTRTLESTPENATHWSTRGMATASGLSQTAVSRTWRAFGLKPHLSETFKLSKDPQFVEKVRDVVGLYLAPPQHAIVLSVDEKSQCQALERSAPVEPIRPGRPESHTHDYVRHGTASLFSALNVATGEVVGKCMRRHRSAEFVRLLNQLDAAIPATDADGEAVELHVIMDNYATHKTDRVRRWFARRPRSHGRFTPTGASWINQIERFFAELTTRRLRRGVFKSVPALERAINDYVAQHNRDPKPFVWTADADLILDRVRRRCERTSNSGH
ncbi:IS630 family transposase [Alienimonas californiensis]|uniref:Tc1-like transposase DDE domain-containing protein n=1 Tax=Alienimonas californiensis TaxID=2527989 RepID=A0A517P5H8_9PLAN|nr:IS630 family transposase [Alienimonas californiensis]QDT14611.1 hypothetical protein CA12_06870 [Alienimonas californiensis]